MANESGPPWDNTYVYYPVEQTKGWECPKCGRCYSPSTPQCFLCGNIGLAIGAEPTWTDCGRCVVAPENWTLTTCSNIGNVTQASSPWITPRVQVDSLNADFLRPLRPLRVALERELRNFKPEKWKAGSKKKK